MFPLQPWDRLLPQATLTLNLLRPCRINPSLSAYHCIHGAFDFNKTPLAPPGTKIIAHEKPKRRGTWAPHGQRGWHIGPTMQHCRCWRACITKTNAERISDTVVFFPSTFSMPPLSSTDRAIRAAQDLTEALQNPAPAAPFATFGQGQLDAIKQLADIFHASVTPPTNQPTPVPSASPGVKPTNTPSNQPTLSPGVPPHRYPLHNRSLFTSATVDKLASAFAVLDPSSGRLLEHDDLLKHPTLRPIWNRSTANEFGRCAQGLKCGIKGTDTIRFIPISKLPPGRRATHARMVCTMRPQKSEVERTRATVGGNLIDCPGDVSTRTADLTTTKILWNDVLSTPEARCMCIDVSNFYLNTPVPRKEHMRIAISRIPQEIIDECNLLPLVHNGHVCCEIARGMCGPPQAGRIANDLLAKRLACHGCCECRHTHGSWRHAWRPIAFSLVVDDFGVKHVGKQHAEHLLNTLQCCCKCSADWESRLCCGITLNWDCKNCTCDISMPGYVSAALEKLKHPPPRKPQDSPFPANKPQHSVPTQMTEDPDLSEVLDRVKNHRIRQIIGTFLWHARSVNPTMLTALSSLGSQQDKSTKLTQQQTNHFLDCCATHPDATIRCCASDMILKIHSDASCLSEPRVRSRAAGHFCLGNSNNKLEINNGPILTKSEIIKHVQSSAAEAEVGTAFLNAKEATGIRTTLQELGRPQPDTGTPLQVDNDTAAGIANDTVKQRRSKAIDMRCCWLQDRVNQNQFHVHWAPGSTNLADCFSKHHPAIHHRKMQCCCLCSTASPKFRTQSVPKPLRGCADLKSPGCDMSSGLRVPVHDSRFSTHFTTRHARRQ